MLLFLVQVHLRLEIIRNYFTNYEKLLLDNNKLLLKDNEELSLDNDIGLLESRSRIWRFKNVFRFLYYKVRFVCILLDMDEILLDDEISLHEDISLDDEDRY